MSDPQCALPTPRWAAPQLQEGARGPGWEAEASPLSSTDERRPQEGPGVLEALVQGEGESSGMGGYEGGYQPLGVGEVG